MTFELGRICDAGLHTSRPARTRRRRRPTWRARTPIPADQHPRSSRTGSGHFGGRPVAITHVQPSIVAANLVVPTPDYVRVRYSLRGFRPDFCQPDGPGLKAIVENCRGR
jgi:hypothetical protein